MAYQTLRVANRTNLADAIPLAAPFMIRVDPSNSCNFKCQYCPTAFPSLLQQVGRPKGLMDFGLFEKIVADLQEFPTPVRKVYLYKDGEPTLNKRLPDMIALARAKGVSEVWTTTNGSLLRPELNRRLVEAGLTAIKISIQGTSSAEYLDIAKVKLDYEELRANIRDLYEHRRQLFVHVKIVDANLTPAQKAKFMSDFEGSADAVHIDSLMGWSQSSAHDFTLGTKPATGPDGRALKHREVCTFPFYTLSVNFDGTVSICCVDWSHATVVGDVKQESLRAIWEGDALNEFRLMHLRGQRARNKACGDCQYLQTLADDIDGDAKRLEEHLVSLRTARQP